MRYTVNLRLVEEGGYWGLVHEETKDMFNPFWSADGIFHDVFEHYFEGTHRYFTGPCAYSLYGEMVASGHALAYADIGINNFAYRENTSRDYCIDTTDLLDDWVHDYTSRPSYSIERSICRVPRQVTPDRRTLDYWINQYYDWYVMAEERRPEIKKLMPFNKIKDCYYWGYRRGKRIVGADRDESFKVMDDFLSDWNDITKHYNAQHCHISDEEAYPIHGYRFIVDTQPRLKVTQLIVDQVRNTFDISKLIVP